MNNIDFKRAIAEYDLDLERQMLGYKNSYDDVERQEIFKICRKISRAIIPETNDSKGKIKEEVMGPFFLRSLRVFENPIITDYYTEKVSKIKVNKDKFFELDNAELDFNIPRNGQISFRINLPRKKEYNFTDQMSYSHELGHIPEIDLIRKSFLEYSETLPLFMEYITELRKHRDEEERALDYFLMERLPMEQREARDVMKIYKKVNHKNDNIRLYHAQQFADYYKYLESLDYAIQLVDRMHEDKKAVGNEISKVIMGKSLIEVSEDLQINTTGCKRLIKEYKRMGNM